MDEFTVLAKTHYLLSPHPSWALDLFWEYGARTSIIAEASVMSSRSEVEATEESERNVQAVVCPRHGEDLGVHLPQTQRGFRLKGCCAGM